MSTVFVTNRTDKVFEDCFAGTGYVFAPGYSVEIPVEAAQHIFGYGDKDKEPYLVRLGWIETKNDLPDGIKKLAQFEIADAAPETRRSLSPVAERVPQRITRAGGKLAHQPA